MNGLFERLRRLIGILGVQTTGDLPVGTRRYRATVFGTNPLVKAAFRSDYEPSVSIVFRTALSIRSGAVLDVGANVGQTLLKLLEIDPERQYVGFEPQAPCCAVIEEFIRCNSLPRHEILPIGLSDNTALIPLGVSNPFDVKASIASDFRPEGFYPSYQYVPVFRGDDVPSIQSLERIALLKIDVEGAELEVVRGLADTIGVHRPFIVFEVLPNVLVSTGAALPQGVITTREQRYKEIESELLRYGYVLYLFDDQGQVASSDSVRADDTMVLNYVACPRENAREFAGNN